MILILLIDIFVAVTLLFVGRRHLEDALPLFCFYLILMPIESKIVLPGLFDLSTERVAMLTVLILFLTRQKKQHTDPIPMKRLIYLHIAWAVCSTFYSLSVSTSAKQLIGQVVEYYLLYYILLRTISDVRTVYRIVYAMILAMSLCSTLGLIEAYTGWSILTIFPSNLWITYGGLSPLFIDWGRGLRIRSTFPHPILLGDALAMTIPLALYMLADCKRRGQRCVLWVSLLLMFWAIYKTGSRGPWLAVGLSFVLLCMLGRSRIRRYLLVMGVLTLAMLIARPGIWESVTNLYGSTEDANSPAGASYEFRDALVGAITVAVDTSPGRAMFGYGLGVFRERGLDINHQDRVQHWYTCDNGWALFLYETGYGGLFIMGGLLLMPLAMTLRSYRRLPRPENYFSGVAFAVLIAFYFSLLSVAGYAWGQQGFMAWILISLSIVYPKVALKDRRKSESQPFDSDRQPCLRETDTHLAGSIAAPISVVLNGCVTSAERRLRICCEKSAC